MPTNPTPIKICLCVPNFKSDLIEATSSTTTKLADKLCKDADCTLLVPDDISTLTEEWGKIRWVSFASPSAYSSKVRVFKNIFALGQFFRRSNTNFDVIHFQAGNLLEMFLIRMFVPRIDAVRIISVWQPYVGIFEFFKLPWIFRENLKGIVHHYLFNTWLHLPFFIVGQSYFDKIIVHTNRQRKQLSFIKDERIDVFANGVIGGKPVDYRPSSVPKILYIGHPTAVKGLDILLAALERAKDKATFQVTLALSTFKNVDVQKLVQKHGLEDRVSIVGKIDVYNVMSTHAMLVLPYKTSVGTAWYPNIVLEAYSVGLPIVASATEELLECVKNGVTGTLVPPGNPGALEKAILDLLNDTGLSNIMRINQREEFQKRFTFDKYVKTHQQIYEDMSQKDSTQLQPQDKSGDVRLGRGQSVRDYYIDKGHVQTYEKIRFGNAGGQLAVGGA